MWGRRGSREEGAVVHILGELHDVGAPAAPARRAVVDRVGAPFDRAGPAGAPPGPRAGAPIRENVT